MITVRIEATNGLGGTVRISDTVLDLANSPTDCALATIRPLLTEIVNHRNQKNPADA